jgi:hypothetical protein
MHPAAAGQAGSIAERHIRSADYTNPLRKEGSACVGRHLANRRCHVSKTACRTSIDLSRTKLSHLCSYSLDAGSLLAVLGHARPIVCPTFTPTWKWTQFRDSLQMRSKTGLVEQTSVADSESLPLEAECDSRSEPRSSRAIALGRKAHGRSTKTLNLAPFAPARLIICFTQKNGVPRMGRTYKRRFSY